MIKIIGLHALCVVFLLGLSGTGWSQDTATRAYIPGEILVKFKPAVQKERIQKLHSKLGIIQRGELGLIRVERLKLPVGLSVEAAIALYRDNPDVEYAEPNYLRKALAFPLDPFISRQWALHNTDQALLGTFPPIGGSGLVRLSVDADMDMPEAWNITRGSENLVIAVIDSGVDDTHPDLGDEDRDNDGVLDPEEDQNSNGVLDPGNIWLNPGEDINNNGILDPGDFNLIDDDGNGYVDDIQGWDFVGSQVCTIDGQGACACIPDDPVGDNDPMDDFGHGTPVAGIIAAGGNNREGITGVMWTAKIMPLKVLDSVGCGSVGDEIQAIDYAIRKGARIIVVSSGAPEFSQSEFEAIEAASNAGILVVTPAGNDLSNNDYAPVYPASYELSNVITVAASSFRDDLAFFSNFGSVSVDLAAPGDCIFSTMPTGDFTLQDATNIQCTDTKYNRDYDYNTGTSFAAAHVAGVAGLLLAQDPGLTPAELKAIMISTVDPKPSLDEKVASGGRVNAYRALTRDTGATFSGGTGGDAGCFGAYLDRRDPGSPGTAVVNMLVMALPFLLLASRRLRKIIKI